MAGKNEFNPDYGDDPEVLKGALADMLEATGQLQAEIADLKEATKQCLSLCNVKEDTKEILRLQAENESHLRNIELRAKHNEKLQDENEKLKGEKPIPAAWWKECPNMAQKVMERIMDRNEKLKEFARHVIKVECWSIDEQDGGDIQDLAEKLDLIEPCIATKEDVDEESDFEVGDTIYKFSQTLKGGD